MLHKKRSLLSKGIPLLALLGLAALPKQLSDSPIPAPGLHVPEGFTIEQVVDPALISYPMFASYDERGRLFVFESTEINDMGTETMLKNPTYHVRLLEDTDGDGKFDKSGIFADKIPLPMGGVFHQGSLYVTESPNLVKYTDTDGDGKSDKREVLMSGWVLHANGATLHGPFMGPDGWLYMTDARRSFNITTKEGVNLKGKGARIWRCRTDGSGLEWISAGGFDNSIELAFMPGGETIGTMTYFVDPQGGFRDALMHWVEGGVYPKPNPVIQEDQLKLTGPLMPVLSKTARVAPSGLMRIENQEWGKAFQGNLFSAEFNTGRIMRHEIKTAGASYTSVDTPFMTSSVADSHPTDVLMDADGGMLVVTTGGWFIEGCPLSRVAKPDVIGGIFRIRKNGVAQTKDPWGNAINWSASTPAQLKSLLADKRPAVRKRAIQQLVEKGDASIAVFRSKIAATQDAEEAAALTFAISRIGTPAALAAVRSMLSNKSPLVRTASARALGLARDKAAVPLLSKAAATDVPQVSRQAATALGQIGDATAIPSLLKAVARTDDRFVEHAVIYTLISLNDSNALLSALQNPSERVKKAAIIALDQMDNSPLKKEHLAPFLASNSADLRTVGIWVATHRPEWTDLVVDFMKKQLTKKDHTDEELMALRDLMVTFCKNDEMQQFVSKQLRESVEPAEKLLFLSVIGRCDVRQLPSTWTDQLKELMTSKDGAIVSEALNLIQSRRVKGVDQPLLGLFRNTSVPAALRVKALAARIATTPELGDQDFGLLSDLLGKKQEAPVRQAAVNVLGQMKPTESQLLSVAGQTLPEADPFLLPGLMEVFGHSTSEKVGQRFVQTLTRISDNLTNIPEQDLARILSKYPAGVKEQAKPVIAKIRSLHAAQQERLASLESELKGGDVLEGRKLFFGKASCSACHAVGPEGNPFGPDLTNIGDIRSSSDILEAIVFPSSSFAREHETVNVVTASGTYMGIIKEQTADYVVVAPGPGPGLRINRSEIKSIDPHNVSMMPPGLDELLEKKELADLMAFLESLPDGIKNLKK